MLSHSHILGAKTGKGVVLGELPVLLIPTAHGPSPDGTETLLAPTLLVSVTLATNFPDRPSRPGPRGAHPTVTKLAVGGTPILFRSMAGDQPRPMGSKHHPVRLPNRIFHQSTPGTYPKGNTGPKGPRPKLGSGVRDRNPLRKRGHQKDNRGGGTSHSVLLLSNPQKEWTVASNSQPEAPKQPLCKTQKIQNGDIISRSPGSVPGPMGLECQSKRCILTCPHPREGPAVPDIRVSKSIIQVRRTSLRSLHSPKGLHPGHQRSGSRTEKKRGNPLHLSRRLAYHRKLSHYSFPQYRGSSQPLGPSRVVDKSRKVLTRPFTNNSVPGSNSRPQKKGRSLPPKRG